MSGRLSQRIDRLEARAGRGGHMVPLEPLDPEMCERLGQVYGRDPAEVRRASENVWVPAGSEWREVPQVLVRRIRDAVRAHDVPDNASVPTEA